MLLKSWNSSNSKEMLNHLYEVVLGSTILITFYFHNHSVLLDSYREKHIQKYHSAVYSVTYDS